RAVFEQEKKCKQNPNNCCSYPQSLALHNDLVATAFTPFLLPKMHDRYFYAADIFSIVFAVTTPKMWFLAAAYQVISLLSYTPYLFGINPESTLPTAVIVNTITLGFLLWKQWNMIANPKTSLMRPDNTSLQS
ncbi:MAG: hypothetical protein M1282_07865, partial [Chloroflexi bacterium]|nr:hypothetical protein [Chloroflexota bacterium]